MRNQADLPIDAPQSAGYRPLADRMRPRELAEFVGQAHLLAPGRPLHRLLTDGIAHSMVLWGPPGSGKTTLARLAARACKARFIGLSAVVAGVKDIRDAVDLARAARSAGGPATVLFLDEVHRFNKAQQDTFLPFVEDGTLVFIGATTENPSFELNSALLSRARVYLLKPLAADELTGLLQRALADPQRGLGTAGLGATPDALDLLADAADGDARRALNLLEVAADLATDDRRLTIEIARQASAGGHRRFDKRGELFYDQISALHKSVRDSDPDAALYWLCRMLDGGCDPGFLARRLVRMASEEIGNADPRALTLSLAAWDSYDRLGSPEGELALAQACLFMACAPKSNAVYKAYGAAMDDAKSLGTFEVPLHLRNAPTRLMKDLGYGRGYRYAHDEPDALAPGQRHFPDAMKPRDYYDPAPRGLELRLRETLERRRHDSRAASDVDVTQKPGDDHA
ncbi:MAG: replication-associated recombination protein A [Steroidobacteraceae bacterium]